MLLVRVPIRRGGMKVAHHLNRFLDHYVLGVSGLVDHRNRFLDHYVLGVSGVVDHRNWNTVPARHGAISGCGAGYFLQPAFSLEAAILRKMSRSKATTAQQVIGYKRETLPHWKRPEFRAIAQLVRLPHTRNNTAVSSSNPFGHLLQTKPDGNGPCYRIRHAPADFIALTSLQISGIVLLRSLNEIVLM